MDIRRVIREELLRVFNEHLLTESINLNLSKQIRSMQLSDKTALEVNKKLEGIFGKNVYRLYYDLNTGKQITPTNRDPKLKFDVNVIDRLKGEIVSLLDRLGFTLIDMDENIAKNNKNGQTIKVSKVLNSTDNTIFKQYTEYLGALSKGVDGTEKLYVVVSRHSHDIAGMSSHPKISSCEDIGDKTDISQLNISDDSLQGEGEGMVIWEEIKSSSIVFYLIKEGDWNIKDPLSRFLGTGICQFGNSHHFYGKFSNDFKNFVTEWLKHYKSKVLKQYTVFSDESFFDKSADDLLDIIAQVATSDIDKNNYIFRGLVKNKRYDVLYDMLFKRVSEVKDGRLVHSKVYDDSKASRLIGELHSIFGYKVFNQLPNNIKDPLVNHMNSELDELIANLEFYNKIIKTPEKFKERVFIAVDKLGASMSLENNAEFLRSTFTRHKHIWFNYPSFGKLVGEKYNTYKKLYDFLDKNGGQQAVRNKVNYIIDDVVKDYKDRRKAS